MPKHVESLVISDVDGAKVSTTQSGLKRALDVSLVDATVDINVSAFTDSIKIGDGSGQTATITDLGGGTKALDVNIADIALDHTSDSIKLGDGTNLITSSVVSLKTGLDVNVINSQTVEVTPSGATLLVYGEKLNLGLGATYNVVNYTVPAGNPKYIQKIYFSGTQVGTATISVNATTVLRIRLSPAVFTQILDIASGSAFGRQVVTGDVVTIEAENNGSGLGDFDATLQLMET